MMKLSQAAGFFYTTTFEDAYGGPVSFKGRLMAYEDVSRDSLSTERRIMAVAPGTTIPARRVVKVGEQHWIIGTESVDHHEGTELRNKYIVHRADELAQVKTFAQALSGAAGQSLWSDRLWMKETKEPDESSNLYGLYQIYFSKSEDIRDPEWDTAGVFFDGREDNVLVHMEGRWHLVRATATTSGGLRVAVADELPEPVVLDVQFSSNVYDRKTDTKVPTTTTVKVINLRWQTYFTYLAEYSPKFEKGDIQFVVLKTQVTPSAGDTVVALGRKFRVVTVFDQHLVWSVHLRHV